MHEKMVVSISGRSVAERGNDGGVSDAHYRWMEGLLEESPASLQGVVVSKLSEGEMTMEWQAVFQGAGVAYLQMRGNPVAVALLLEGRFVSSESAAIEAIQQTVLAGRPKNAGFEMVRKCRGRPLRAVIILDENSPSEVVAAAIYWSECLASVCFRTVSGQVAEPRAAIPGTDYSASTM